MFTLNMLNAGGKKLNLNELASVLSPIIYLTAVIFLKKKTKHFFFKHTKSVIFSKIV